MKGKGLVSGDPGRKLKKLSLVLFTALSVVVFGSQQVPAIDLLASGMATPETISPANGAYGGLFSDSYFVPDPGRTSGVPTDLTNVWTVNKTTGALTLFSHPTNTTTVGGLFLPGGWGDYSNKFMTVGFTNFGTPPDTFYRSGYFNVYNADGTYTTPLILQGVANVENYAPKTPILAPTNWGSLVNGNLLIADGAPAVYAIDSNWQKKTLITNPVYPELARFGLAFAPANWGTVGGQLLTSSDFVLRDVNNNPVSITGRITAVDSTGNETKWAEIPISVTSTTLRGFRQMAFTPDGFIPGQHELLLVSVSGSQYGGGTLGDIWAFDSNGQLVAALRDTLNLDKFDPRGLYFEGDKLIISDSSDPIWIATSADFQIVPLPPSVFLLGSGLLGLVGLRRFRKS
jgi:hypothetical protein